MKIEPKVLALAAALLGLASGATPVFAAEHEVRMLNRGEAGAMVFEPAWLEVAPGDTVTFVPTDRSHNAESIAAMLPSGAAPFKGKMNEAVTVTFSEEGVYGYKCLPHYAMGMVGIVVVGDAAVNLDAAAEVKHPGKARAVMAELLEKAAP
ncbi:pseudoazurin [Parvibaculum lavamentivorans DS-1]|uniref:Pseudoazurin n=1 Tax=Parvibaculum lavamentivorans (strain DS-1 / DSM 13023 / NCIMB 13966) TaxID=402881 RepID=A7HRU8_PARL1|nr:pseudoazurin [Parvibaculum lavamentivorans]ABS62631.1 pseudoazurin [Parvibaculum lavamentivorans DS-1]